MNTNTFKPEAVWSFVSFEFNASRVAGCTSSKLRSQTSSAAALRAALNEYKSSARAKARARTNVAQSMGPQPSRVGITIATRKALVALPRGLRLELGMQPFPALTATPNPTVNRTPHGRPGLDFISFSPKPALPRVAGYLER